MKRFLRAFLGLPIVCLPLMSGCWDRLDPENRAFIMAIGVDPGPSNDFIYTFAVAMPKSSNGAAGGDTSGGGSEQIVDVFSQEASNLTAALMTSQSYVARRLTLIHSKVFVLGESLARKGIMPVMGEVVRNNEFRRTVNVITTKGRADTFIHSIKPTMEKDINLWFELELDPHNIGAVTPKHSRFHDFIVDMEQPGTGATTILSAARSDIEKGTARIPNGSSDRESPQPISEDEYAGTLHRSGETPIDFFGSAVYRGEKMAGFLSAYETIMMNMLRGEFEKTTLEFRDPSEEKLTMSIIINEQKRPDIDIKRNGDEVQVFFKVRMEGDLIGSFSKLDYTLPHNQAMLEASVEEQLKERASKMLEKTLHQWSTDCFHIGNRVRTTFPTLKEWYAYKWRDHIKDAKYRLDIRFQMRRHGDQVGPAVEGDKLNLK
ncbi:Ger(x)C family spore germination protein [Paenibacillus sp. D51F]